MGSSQHQQNLSLTELLDMAEVQGMVEAHYKAAAMPTGIIDALDGGVLAGAGWQDICTRFHRANPVTQARCRESDLAITERLKAGESSAYKCRNGLWDIGIPILVKGRHLATLFLGQFFYEGEDADTAFFERQAGEFGFDKAAYLEALARVPVFSKEKVENILAYNTALAGFLGRAAESSLAQREQVESSRRAQEALQEGESRFRALFENAPLAYQSLDENGFFLDVNRKWLDALGHAAKDEVVGKWFGDFLAPGFREHFDRNFPMFKQACVIDGVEFDMVRKDGGAITVAFNGRVQLDKHGKFERTHCIFTDITERKRVEDELRTQAKYLEAIIQTTVDGFLMVDGQGRIVAANTAYCGMTGYGREEIIGLFIGDLDANETPEETATRIGRIIANGSEVFEAWHRRKDGSIFPVEISVAFLNERGGEFICFCRDISERKQAKEVERHGEARLRKLLEIVQYDCADIQDLLDFALDKCLELTGSRFGYIYHYDENSQTFTLNSWSREVMQACSIVKPQTCYELSKTGIWGEAVRQRRAIIVNDFQADNPLRKGYPEGHAPLTSFLTVPIVSNNRIVAVVGVANKQTAYSANDVLQLSLLMDATWRVVERRNAEEDLRKSEEQNRLLIELSPLPLAVQDRQGRLYYFNKRFIETFGYTLEDFPDLATGFPLAYPDPEYRAEVARRWQEASEMADREGGPIRGGEFTFRGKDGKVFILDIVGMPIQDRDMVIFQDVTERKRAEEALRRSEGKFRHILEQVPLIGISLDTRGRLTFANDHFLKLAGWTREEALGKDWFEAFIPPEFHREMRGVFLATMATQDAFDYSSYVNDILARDGRRLTVAWANVLTKDAAGFVTDVTCLGVDLTERSRSEKLLLDAKEAAEAANKAKGEFLANMSHELRTPLNGVLGMLQLLDAEPAIRDDDKVLLETAMESGRGLLTIINDILSFAQLDAGKLTIAREPTSLREIVDSLCRAFHYEVQEKGLSLVATVDDSVPGQVLSDAGRLRQIILNLITNALKFTSEGRVEVAASMLPCSPWPADRLLLVSVTDTGIGIPDDKLGIIFEPFTQVDGSLTRKYKGTGIGLGIVRQLVRLMGGTVCVTSQVGVGTSITFTVRCGVQAQEPRAVLGSAAGEPRPLHGLRVLVAEDDRVNLFTATRFLERMGCAVTGAGDGREALRLLGADDYDCILMDIQMPELDGIEATRAIRSTRELGAKAHIPIIAMTAHAMPGDREKFLAAGMDGYISKPVDMDELSRVLSDAVSDGKC